MGRGRGGGASRALHRCRITLLRRFEWITWLFALILLYRPAAGARRLGGSGNSRVDSQTATGEGSLLPVILAVEVTDLLFAVDSIPAVLAISHNPSLSILEYRGDSGASFVVLALASLLDRLRYLHLGWARAGFCRAEDARRPLD